MAFKPEHEMHRRRFSRNLGLGLVLAGFVALVFALTVVKVLNGDMMHANDSKKNTGVYIDPAKTGTQP
jgi:hypothetical protein